MLFKDFLACKVSFCLEITYPIEEYNSSYIHMNIFPKVKYIKLIESTNHTQCIPQILTILVFSATVLS